MVKLISVVIPTFNRNSLTDRAVESVAPTRPDLFEIIVVDDCGTIPYAYGRNVNPSGVSVLTFRTSINAGPGLARKLGVEKSEGSVIAFLDSDDVFEAPWPDAILSEVSRHEIALQDSLFIAGNVLGGSPLQCFWARLFATAYEPWQTTWVRLAAIAFNPFYTPATVISRKICSFSETSRYCEDYFTNAMAIFRAKRISILPVTACKISRPPGTSGGLSELRKKMRQGEFDVRKNMLFDRSIPLGYRVLVPLGMVYAAARVSVKCLLRMLRH